MSDSKKQSKVFIQNIFEGSPVQKAGLKEGDVIISINDQPVSTFSDYIDLVKPGTPYDVEVLRQGVEFLRFHVDVPASSGELKTEADYARVIGQIERATGDKKVFNN